MTANIFFIKRLLAIDILRHDEQLFFSTNQRNKPQMPDHLLEISILKDLNSEISVTVDILWSVEKICITTISYLSSSMNDYYSIILSKLFNNRYL